MPVEKVTQVSQTKPWYGALSSKYGEALLKTPEPGLYGQYTYGIAGERFFREIKDNAKITGTKCQKCNLIYVPPRIYCERCFEGLEEWCEIENKGEIYTYTISWVDLDGSRLEEPVILALVKFDGIYGGIVHKVEEVSADNVKIGMKVAAVFKEKREGSILDIKYFKPI
jgi:uncharacterized OB-fold protein